MIVYGGRPSPQKGIDLPRNTSRSQKRLQNDKPTRGGRTPKSRDERGSAHHTMFLPATRYIDPSRKVADPQYKVAICRERCPPRFEQVLGPLARSVTKGVGPSMSMPISHERVSMRPFRASIEQISVHNRKKTKKKRYRSGKEGGKKKKCFYGGNNSVACIFIHPVR